MPARIRLTHHFPAEVVDPAVEVGGDAQLRRHVLRHHRAGRGGVRDTEPQVHEPEHAARGGRLRGRRVGRLKERILF